MELTFDAAWTVNFVLSLRSFEADLKGTRSLIDLALSSPYSEPPRLLFISSIGVFTRAFLLSVYPLLPTQLCIRLLPSTTRPGGAS